MIGVRRSGAGRAIGWSRSGGPLSSVFRIIKTGSGLQGMSIGLFTAIRSGHAQRITSPRFD